MTAVGAGAAASVGTPWVGAAAAATEDELAFASFGSSTEFLLKDFYARALDAKILTGPRAGTSKRGRSAATQHANALSDLLVGVGAAPPVEEDFEFAWPEETFESEKAIVTTGVGVLRALPGAYRAAAASVADPAYRSCTRAWRQAPVSSPRSRPRQGALRCNRSPSHWISSRRATRSTRTWART